MNHSTILHPEDVVKMEPSSPQPSPFTLDHRQDQNEIHQNQDFFGLQDKSIRRNILDHFQWKRPSVLRNMGARHSNLVRLVSFLFNQ